MAAAFVLLGLSVVFDDIQLILSLVAGSICGTIIFILPIFFYREAYIKRPSKKNRSCLMYMGYASAVLILIIGCCGIYANIKSMVDS